MKNAFATYQEQARITAQYPDLGNNLIYPALKLAGESGEVADKIGKYWRNSGKFPTFNTLDEGQKEAIILELGDVLWYVSAICSELEIRLEYVAKMNIKKLQDRAKRNVIKSEGDNR